MSELLRRRRLHYHRETLEVKEFASGRLPCILAHPAAGDPDYACHPVRLCDAVQGLLTGLKFSWVQLSSLCFH